MRILAIRGQNLASLRSFDLALEELEAAGGLFAITGPTGAGKSTLLDALCLALYDKTPRLAGNSTHKVGRGPDDPHQLGANDVRTILRRGTTQGFAEVDFVGQDGGHYRARWSVKRAHGKPDGKLQAQTVTLTDLLDGQVRHADTKTKTLEIIEEKVGLSFDQFRRSVLLAQGEFDAFLRAPVEDRGKLLERMTGTDIYRRLSQGAHRKEKEARETLERLTLRVADRPVLPEAERAALEGRFAAALDWVGSAEGRRDRVNENLRWYAELHAREHRLEGARTALAAAEVHWQAAADRRARLAAVQAAEPLRGKLESADAARARAERAMAVVGEAEAAFEQATRHLDEARRHATEAASELDAARHAEVAARPHLLEARRLDVELAQAERARTEAHQRAQEALAAAEAAERERTAARAILAGHEADARQAAAWLADHAALNSLCDQWDRWQTELQRWATTLTREQRARQQLRTATEAWRAAEARLPEVRARAEATNAAWQAAQTRRETARAATEAEPTGAAQSGLQRLAEVREALGRLQHLAEQVRQGGEERQALLDRARDAHGKAKFARARAEAIEAEARAERAHLAEARRSLELTRSVLQLADHRAQLVAGEPCPLCGAREHPGVSASTAVELAQGDRVRHLEDRVRELERSQAQAHAEADAEQRRAHQAEEDARHRQESLAAVQANWTVALMGVGELDPPKNPYDPATFKILERCRDDLDERTTKATHRLREAERRATEWKNAVQQAETTRAERDGALAERAAVERQGEEAARTRQAAESDLAREERTRIELEHVLTPVLGDAQWVDVAERDPAAYLATCARNVGECKHVRERRERALALAQTQRAEVDRRSQRAESAALVAQQHTTELTIADARYRDLATRRAALFGGQAADRVERTLVAAVSARQVAFDEASAARAADEAAAEGARARVDAARRSEADARTEADLADAALMRALAETSMELSTLRALLVHGPAWQQAEAATLAQLERAVDDARIVVTERSHDRDTHAHTAPPEPEPALVAEGARLQEAVEVFKRLAVDAQVKLERDDEARRARAHLAAAIDAAAAEHQRWQALDALIGSADGKTFSNFAQSLTLEAVLSHANQHLHDLHRRYQLMRVPGEDLALQVIDREMGDEVRSLQSLSGGETFLVSLALALGLASLVSGSDRDLKIDSLFIDEGFGTLDPDTLDAVIEALDALQQTGRQVGIISHVPGLDERIGVMVQVEPRSAGLSEVSIVQGG